MERSNILTGDVVVGALLALLGAYVVFTASNWSFIGPDGPGPGFFPMFYGTCLIIGSLALIVTRLRAKAAQEDKPVDWYGVQQALLVWLVFVLMIPAMKYVGFAVAFAGLIVFFLQFIFKRSWTFTALAAVFTPIGFLVVFPTLLGVQLPVGQWTGF